VLNDRQDPTHSVKPLKEVVVLRIGPVPPGPAHHVTIIQYIMSGNKHKIQIHKNESKHSEMGPVKRNPVQGAC